MNFRNELQTKSVFCVDREVTVLSPLIMRRWEDRLCAATVSELRVKVP